MSVLLGEAAAGVFEERLHPRGRGGRWVEVLAHLRLNGHHDLGHGVRIERGRLGFGFHVHSAEQEKPRFVMHDEEAARLAVHVHGDEARRALGPMFLARYSPGEIEHHRGTVERMPAVGNLSDDELGGVLARTRGRSALDWTPREKDAWREAQRRGLDTARDVPAVAALSDTSPERLALERTDRVRARRRDARAAVMGEPGRVSKAQALVDSGLADDLADARAQLADMGERGGRMSPARDYSVQKVKPYKLPRTRGANAKLRYIGDLHASGHADYIGGIFRDGEGKVRVLQVDQGYVRGEVPGEHRLEDFEHFHEMPLSASGSVSLYRPRQSGAASPGERTTATGLLGRPVSYGGEQTTEGDRLMSLRRLAAQQFPDDPARAEMLVQSYLKGYARGAASPGERLGEDLSGYNPDQLRMAREEHRRAGRTEQARAVTRELNRRAMAREPLVRDPGEDMADLFNRGMASPGEPGFYDQPWEVKVGGQTFTGGSTIQRNLTPRAIGERVRVRTDNGGEVEGSLPYGYTPGQDVILQPDVGRAFAIDRYRVTGVGAAATEHPARAAARAEVRRTRLVSDPFSEDVSRAVHALHGAMGEHPMSRETELLRGPASPGERVGRSGAVKWSGDRLAGLRHVVDHHSAREIDGYVVDPTTASLLLQVHGALKPENKARFGSVPLPQLVALAWGAAR